MDDFFPYLSWYDREFYMSFKDAAMDQNYTYASFFKKHLSHAEIISDHYHMTANAMGKIRICIAWKLRDKGGEGGKVFQAYELPAVYLNDEGLSQAKIFFEFDRQLQVGHPVEKSEEIGKVTISYVLCMRFITSRW